VETSSVSTCISPVYPLCAPPGETPVLKPSAGGSLAPEVAGVRGWILVVEDEPDALAAIVELLEAEGLPAVGARHGEEALALMRGGWTPALVLVDLKMPVMDGWGFCEQLGGDVEFRDTPVAIFTASAAIGTLPYRRVDAGYFQKPLDFDRLLRIADRFCR
jgi:CheY-like chemotaxis protein